MHDDRGDSKSCKAINVCNEYCTAKPRVIKHNYLAYLDSIKPVQEN